MITLRPWQWRDVPQLIHICNNVHIWNNLRDQMPRPYRHKDAEEWVRFNMQQQPQRNFCIDENGVMIGGIGMVPQQDIYKRNIEIGYYIGEEYWGKGHATKAVALMIDHIFSTTDCYRIFAEVFAHNQASMAVLRKNGFHREAILEKAIFKNDQLIDAHLWVRFREP